MGRGRQKAKQTKVARQLKYYSPETDYSALQRELAGGAAHAGDDSHTADEVEDDETDDEDGEYVGWSAGHGR